MLKLSAVQRFEVLKTVSDPCVMAKVDQNSLISSVHPQNSPLLSRLLSKEGGQTDNQ